MTADAGPLLSQTNGITKDEVDVYDRQIRLWGLEAQNMLRNSSVLIVGLSPLGAEVTKNLMLCGLKALTIADSKDVDDFDVISNFLLQDDAKINRATACSMKAKALNPMVDFKVVEKGITDFADDDLKNCDLIILIDQPFDSIIGYNEFCRTNNIKFIAGSVFGWFGYAFFDFNNHSSLMKQPKAHEELNIDEGTACVGDQAASTIEEDVFKKEQLTYPSFVAALNVDWSMNKYIRKAKRLVPPSYVYLRAILRAHELNIDICSEEMSKIFSEEREKVHRSNLIFRCSFGVKSSSTIKKGNSEIKLLRDLLLEELQQMSFAPVATKELLAEKFKKLFELSEQKYLSLLKEASEQASKLADVADLEIQDVQKKLDKCHAVLSTLISEIRKIADRAANNFP